MSDHSDEKLGAEPNNRKPPTGRVLRLVPRAERELETKPRASETRRGPANHNAQRPTWEGDDPGPTAA